MKQFFKMLLAVLIGLFLFVFLTIGFFAAIGLAAAKKETANLKPNSILELDLNYIIPEKSTENPFATFDFTNFKPRKAMGLHDLCQTIREAAENEHIKGIYLPLGMNTNGYASLDMLRSELQKFKKSGKFIIAHGQMANQRSYYLCSVADQIYMEPTGVMELTGFGRQITYYKGFLDKAGIKMLDFHEGTYKSFVEPFVRTDMSEANREQLMYVYGDIYRRFATQLAESRKLDTATVADLINNLKVVRASQAKEHRLLDGLKYKHQVDDLLRSKTGKKTKEDLIMADPEQILAQKEKEGDFNNRIAVLVAEGDIVDGEGGPGEIGGDTFAEEVRKLADDEKVKAIVVRINSPGGSAMASDLIWSELIRAKKKKPVIASMGDVAASGGYYIAAPAERIFCEPFTITGSIGVFGLIPNAENLLTEKLGLTFDEVEVNEHAVQGGINKPMDPLEEKVVRESVAAVYMDFKQHVAEGRKMSVDAVEQVAQGRVWTGRQALERKLADQIGTLDDAVKYAAKKANVKDYRLRYYPAEKSIQEQIMEGFAEARASNLRKELGSMYPLYAELKKISSLKGIQMRLVEKLD